MRGGGLDPMPRPLALKEMVRSLAFWVIISLLGDRLTRRLTLSSLPVRASRALSVLPWSWLAMGVGLPRGEAGLVPGADLVPLPTPEVPGVGDPGLVLVPGADPRPTPEVPGVGEPDVAAGGGVGWEEPRRGEVAGWPDEGEATNLVVDRPYRVLWGTLVRPEMESQGLELAALVSPGGGALIG